MPRFDEIYALLVDLKPNTVKTRAERKCQKRHPTDIIENKHMIHTILMQSITMSMKATTASTAMAVAVEIGFKDQAKVTTLNSFPLFRSLVIEFRCYLIPLTNHLKRNHLLKRKIAKVAIFRRKISSQDDLSEFKFTSR